MSKGKMGFWTIVLFGINSIIGSGNIYAKEAFGNFIGYEVGFLTWITRIIAFSTMGVGFATALGGIMPELSTPLMKNIIVTVIFALLAINFCTAGNYEPVWRAAV